jgi:uncharacterized protein (DUF849 family)
VLVKACLNGRRRPNEHPAVPVTPAEVAREASRAVEQGALAVHVHARGPDGLETLDSASCGATLRAVREACPGVPVGLTTGAWIEPDPVHRVVLVHRWEERPDFASANFSEEGTDELCATLLDLGIGIEAGLASLADARAFSASRFADRCLRVLVEVDGDAAEAVRLSEEIDAELDRADVEVPRVHHGYDIATWAVVEAAVKRGRDLRVGLEDTLVLPDGRLAAHNGELVAAAVRLAAGRSG